MTSPRNATDGSLRRIISLSSIPPRFPELGGTLRSLLGQRAEIDEIRLYLPRRYRRFPEFDGAVPSVPEGITIVRPEEDLGPATKILYAARDLRGEPAQILFCDDDRLFRPDWAGDLFAAQEARPADCVSLVGKLLPDRRTARRPRAILRRRRIDVDYRVRQLRQQLASLLSGETPAIRETRRPVARAGYADILQGLGGVVVRPDFFDDEAFAIPEILWTVDDVWLSGMLARRGIAVWLPSGLRRPFVSLADGVWSLYGSVIDGSDRDGANAACVAYLRSRYGIWA